MTKTKDIGEITSSSQFTGLTAEQLFNLKKFRTEFEIKGLKGKTVFHINTTGKELQEICKRNNWDPDKPEHWVMMIDAVAHYDILKALNKGILQRKIIAELKVHNEQP
ncbi:MAG: hypothetical protein NTX92_08925 [Euryarchaeota archaeon]|nr:hypothetical protein [Euryarchaeota archaeon]